jgi:hypothetical protein
MARPFRSSARGVDTRPHVISGRPHVISGPEAPMQETSRGIGRCAFKNPLPMFAATVGVPIGHGSAPLSSLNCFHDTSLQSRYADRCSARQRARRSIRAGHSLPSLRRRSRAEVGFVQRASAISLFGLPSNVQRSHRYAGVILEESAPVAELRAVHARRPHRTSGCCPSGDSPLHCVPLASRHTRPAPTAGRRIDQWLGRARLDVVPVLRKGSSQSGSA